MKKLIILALLIISCKSTTNETGLDAKDIEHETVVEESKAESPQVKKCDIDKVVNLKKQLPLSVNIETVRSFLGTISKDCKNNVEFSQFANKILFETLESDPESFFKALSNGGSIDRDQVYAMLETPIGDRVDLNVLVSDIENMDVDPYEKDKVIKSLLVAISKSN